MKNSKTTGQFKAYPLDQLEGLSLNGVLGKTDTHKGIECLYLEKSPEIEEGVADGPTFAIVENSNFHNGIIEISLSGAKQKDTTITASRGFVGLAFRIQSQDSDISTLNPAGVSQFECIYFRPTNSVAENQLRRNHSVQYFAYPDSKFDVLREKSPAVYETYVAIVPDEWFRARIEVEGDKAKLYVNGVSEPTLIVNDLKLGDSNGAIGLFVDGGTDAYYSDLRVIHYMN